MRSGWARAIAVGALVGIAVAVTWFARDERPAPSAAAPVEVARLLKHLPETSEKLSDVTANELLLRDALRRAPGSVAARRKLADVLVSKARLAPTGRLEALREADVQAKKVLAMAPLEPDVHGQVASMHYYFGRYLEALREIAWILGRNPRASSYHLHLRTRIAFMLGQDDALQRDIAACRAIGDGQGCGDAEVRRIAILEGRAAFERILADRVRERPLHDFERVRTRIFVGRLDEAELALETAEQSGLVDHFDRVYLEGMIAAARGDRDLGGRKLGELAAILRAGDFAPVIGANGCWQLAELAALLGRTDEVVSWARQGLSRGYWNDEYWERFFLFEEARRGGALDEVIAQARRRGDAVMAEARRAGVWR